MNKMQLRKIRIVALISTILIASLSLGNLFTVASHGVDFETPEADNVKMAYDPLNNDLLFLTDFKVKNHGAYGIDDIDINAKLLHKNNVKLVDFTKNDVVVPRGNDKIVDIAVALDLDKLTVLDWLKLTYQDSGFKLRIDIDASYMFNLIDVTVDEEIYIPWTSPTKMVLENETIINSLFLIIENSLNKTSIVKPEQVSSVKNFIETGYYKNTYFERYSLEIIIDHLSNFRKQISTTLEVFLPKINATLTLGFKVELDVSDGSIAPTLKEVTVSICC
jgi:hypothetical protein